ncbi:MAG TPA: iron hydrogenase [Clostridiales bacterium]|nr:iron hydrogenase [Clostridiales bacterium]
MRDRNTTFEELYRYLLHSAKEKAPSQAAKELDGETYDVRHLDCLLHPQKHPVIWRLGKCHCKDPKAASCLEGCEFDAIHMTPDGPEFDVDNCVGCAACVERCKENNLVASRDAIAVLEMLAQKKEGQLVYAMIAPAFLGQFQDEVTPGKLRTCLKRLGFDGMLEVASFADILTLKESYEFVENILEDGDYQLTSCCCPMWISMIRKVYHQLIPHVPPAVSPMVACGRTIKFLHPNAITVFIGPCLAKKAEAREPDIQGSVDYVLTFQEALEIFNALELDPAAMEESEKEISSRAGRIYARTGGVSEAVASTVRRISPNHAVPLKTKQADGVKACKAMLNDIMEGNISANFYEGMGCVGGCVGGPKAIIPREKATVLVDQYGDTATYPTPIDNPHVIELLKRLGINTPKELLNNSDIFTRDFSKS